jgi:hypothetical protein
MSKRASVELALATMPWILAALVTTVIAGERLARARMLPELRVAPPKTAPAAPTHHETTYEPWELVSV